MYSMKYKKISIITTCYNHENFIEETINSVISQKYPNLEYIVINDASTDGSHKIISKYEKYISKYINLKEFQPSPVFALNHGFNLSTGDILGWISSDDILLERSLFTLNDIFLQLPEVDWLTGVSTTLNKESLIVKSVLRPITKFDFLSGNWQIIQQESTFFSKSLWNKIGGKFDVNCLQAFDTKLWVDFFEYAIHYHVNAPLGAFRKGEQSRSSRNFKEFLSYNNLIIGKMLKNSKTKEKFIAGFYKYFGKTKLKYLMRLLPNLFLDIGILKHLKDHNINYDFNKKKWEIQIKSSFKRVF